MKALLLILCAIWTWQGILAAYNGEAVGLYCAAALAGLLGHMVWYRRRNEKLLRYRFTYDTSLSECTNARNALAAAVILHNVAYRDKCIDYETLGHLAELSYDFDQSKTFMQNLENMHQVRAVLKV